MKTRFAPLLACAACAAWTWYALAGDPLLEALQQGLLEEEVHRDLPAAVQAYERAVQLAQTQRRAAVTALFRLGEVHRKLGRTNDAVAAYQRVLREFPDESTLAKLSRENLVVLGAQALDAPAPAAPVPAPDPEPAPATSEEADEIRRIRAIIQDSPDLVNARHAPGTSSGTPLHSAAAKGFLAVTEYLLANRADVNARDGSRQTPLLIAAGSGHKRLCEVLLAAGADVNAADESGYTPLHRAALYGYRSVAETLLAAGAQVNTQGYVPPADRQPPRGSSGWLVMETTPLHAAAEKGFLAVTQLLLDHGAHVNAQDRGGRTPLLRAVLGNQPAVAQALLEQGAEPDARDGSGQTALAHAATARNTALVNLLLEAKAGLETPVTAPSPDATWTVLFGPVSRDDVELTRLLLERGADVNAQAASGITPVHVAVLATAPATLKLLLERQPALVRDRGGNAPLHYALEQGRPELVEALLAAGADANAAGWTDGKAQPWWPLFRAVTSNESNDTALRLAQALLAHGANVHAATTNGWTALHLVAGLNRNAIATLLIEQEANVNARGSAPEGWPTLNERQAAERPASATEGGLRAVPPRAVPTARAGLPPIPPPPSGGPFVAGVAFPLSSGPNLTADRDVTPLHVAVAALNLELSRFLLAHGAEVNARDAEGRTPLHFAVHRRDLETIRALLEARADANAKDTAGTTPLALARSLPTTVYGTQAASRGLVVQAESAHILALLREYGARTVTSDPNAIVITRPSTGFQQATLRRGTNDWNQFTLLELLAIHYELLLQSGERASEGPRPPGVGPLQFPDLAKLRILRPGADGKEEVLEPNLTAALIRPDCGADVWLKWGDVVEVPEADHPVSQVWNLPGLSPLLTLFKQCLERTVEIRIKGEAGAYALSLPLALRGDGPDWTWQRGRYGWDLATTLTRSRLVRTSSDLTRVRVTRRATPASTAGSAPPAAAAPTTSSGPAPEPAAKDVTTWTLDLTDPALSDPGFWLRDGDVIEVPDKQDAAPVHAATGSARVLGEVQRPGVVALTPDRPKDIIDALAECGGLTDQANPRIEFTRGGQTRKFTLEQLKAEADPGKKIWLEPGDTIEVKRNLF